MLALPTKHQTTTAGVLLVGHGTRSAVGRRQFFQLCAEVSRRLPLPVEPAFLELAEPTIGQAVERLLARGIESLVVAPLLLFAAGHAKQDVPGAVSAALAEHGADDLPTRQTPPFGCHPQIASLAHHLVTQAIGVRDPVPLDQTLLILVGRGSHDPTATQEMHQLARLIAGRAELPHVQVAFMAMASPKVDEVLEGVGQDQFRRIVVQPHLLFHGELVERLEKQVRTIASQRPNQEWLSSSVLAADHAPCAEARELLAAATTELIVRQLCG